MKTVYQPLIVAVLCAALFLLGGGFILSLTSTGAAVAEAKTNTLQTENIAQRTITVVGEGKVSATPDIAQVNIGVQVADPDVQAATQKAAEDMAAVLEVLKAEGVADEDIQTAYYNLYVDRPYGPEGPSSEPLYQVNNNVQVTIRDLDKVTTILGAVIEAGANNINSINFSLSDPSELRVEARQDAVRDAMATAEELADLNGVSLGEVVSVSEVIQSGGVFVSKYSEAAVGMGGGGPISPGEVDITVQLEITYAIAE